MKHRKALPLVVLMLIALSLLPMQVASAEATVTICQVALTRVGFQEGTVTHPGGNTHLREHVAVYNRVSDNRLCSGLNTSASKANWDANGCGPVWRTFLTEQPEGADYEGG